MSLVHIYDTTLRDGTQAEDISFLVEDKIRIAHKLDEMGIHYIEGGWPGSNPKDVAFFKEIKKEKLSKAKIAAFGSTRRAKVTPDKARTSGLLSRQKRTPSQFSERHGTFMFVRRCVFPWRKTSTSCSILLNT